MLLNINLKVYLARQDTDELETKQQGRAFSYGRLSYFVVMATESRLVLRVTRTVTENVSSMYYVTPINNHPAGICYLLCAKTPHPSSQKKDDINTLPYRLVGLFRKASKIVIFDPSLRGLRDKLTV